LRLLQPGSGYRVNVDSLLLLAFAGDRRVDRVVDLGAGVGALALLALHRGIAKRALLVEASAELVLLAQKNLAHAGFEGEARRLDLRREKLSETGVPLVLCNPPYYPPKSHRPARDPSRALARSGELDPSCKRQPEHSRERRAARSSVTLLRSYQSFCKPPPLSCSLRNDSVSSTRGKVSPARLVLVELRSRAPACWS
jgi:16S rRNA G966 N2-methylase RsmD